MPTKAEVILTCGRYCLFVADYCVAMEGDPCRDPSFPSRESSGTGWTRDDLMTVAAAINGIFVNGVPLRPMRADDLGRIDLIERVAKQALDAASRISNGYSSLMAQGGRNADVLHEIANLVGMPAGIPYSNLPSIIKELKE